MKSRFPEEGVVLFDPGPQRKLTLEEKRQNTERMIRLLRRIIPKLRAQARSKRLHGTPSGL